MMPHDVTQADREAADKWYDRDFPGHRGLSKLLAAHRLAAIAEVVAWLLSDSARLDYEASPEPREHFSWWAADVVQRGDHIQEK